MFAREFECPSCGSPIKQSNPGSRSLVCSYCGQTSHLNAESLQAAGEKHLLADYGSILSVGAQGKLYDRDFLVLGRIRIDYEDGFWDEWYIQYLDDGSTAWIQEDDGSFVHFTREKEVVNIPGIFQLKVGSWSTFADNWEKTFITSRSAAQVNGGEGELPFRIIPGEKANFVEGIQDGKIVSIEILPDEKVLFTGFAFDINEFVIG
ncbi:MAG: DUF4178 domain-containing protein [Bacteroidota bacterium]